MCEIKTKFSIGNSPVIICTEYHGDFMSAKSVRLFNRRGDYVDITQFAIEETKQCFNNNPISPIVKIDDKVSDDFLEVGNRVEFCRKVVAVNKPSQRPVRPSTPRRRELAYA